MLFADSEMRGKDDPLEKIIDKFHSLSENSLPAR